MAPKAKKSLKNNASEAKLSRGDALKDATARARRSAALQAVNLRVFSEKGQEGEVARLAAELAERQQDRAA